MRKPKELKEQDYYPLIDSWLKRYHHCFQTGINTGLSYGRIDVVGVKDVGGQLSGEIETISVEVKRKNEPFATACGQALGYKVYAHRVYLAAVREEGFTHEEITIANHMGIGLIQIKGKKSLEILSSPYFHPLTSMNLLLLEKLALGQCRLCGCFFAIGSIDSKFSNLTRTNIKTALEMKKGLMFWNHTVGLRKKKTHLWTPADNEFVYERRFICPDCIKYVDKWTALSCSMKK
jgi:hypothetical protein